jgi:hypothetical protein
MSAKAFMEKVVSGKRKRTEYRYRRRMGKLIESDAVKAERYAGHVLSKSAILRIFGYSPNTYINDTRLRSNKLIRKLSNGKYKVVAPRG